MKYQDSIDEAIWIERTKFNKTYKEIAEKLQVSMYRVKKVINERSQNGNKNRNRKRNKKERKDRKNKKSNMDT